MRGITLTIFHACVKPDATKEDLRRISDEQVFVIHKRQYRARMMGASVQIEAQKMAARSIHPAHASRGRSN